MRKLRHRRLNKLPKITQLIIDRIYEKTKKETKNRQLHLKIQVLNHYGILPIEKCIWNITVVCH